MPVEIKVTVPTTEALFNDHTLDVPCPKCGEPISKTIGWLRANSDLTCPSCGEQSALSRDDLDNDIKRAERTLLSKFDLDDDDDEADDRDGD